MSTQGISKWHGMWKDDRGRFVQVECYDTKDDLSVGFFIEDSDKKKPQLYSNGDHFLDGSKLMERKRGEEKGWPL